MANTTITVTSLDYGSNSDPAGTAVVAGNNHVITPTRRMGKVLIRLKNTTASTKVWTITAGDSPPAESAGQGDLTVSLTDGSTTPTYAWLVLEGARFMQDNGTIIITVAAATTGFISAFQLPN